MLSPVDSRFCRYFVIPAKAGIQTPPPLRRHFARLSLAVVYACPGGGTLTLCVNVLDSRLRGNDESVRLMRAA
ncbi:MAG: hypothetical protein ACR2P4_10510 [Gammaproteobacteria bacterium]